MTSTINTINQFDKFLSVDNFELAFKRLQTSPRDLYKDLYYEDTKIFGSTELTVLNLVKRLICKRIDQKVYKNKLSKTQSLAQQDL